MPVDDEVKISPVGVMASAEGLRRGEFFDALENPALNLLAGYPEHLHLVHRLLATDGGMPLLRQPERLAELTAATRAALVEVMQSKGTIAALDTFAEECCDTLGKARPIGPPQACYDVAYIAVKDAMLAGVVLWLRDMALTRVKSRKSNGGKKRGPQSPAGRAAQSERATAQHRKRR